MTPTSTMLAQAVVHRDLSRYHALHSVNCSDANQHAELAMEHRRKAEELEARIGYPGELQ